ncbi:MAG: peptidoglycan-binding protein [Candidatus Pacebacteria bacterium]|nr:peptidoglycan-binding protein [Candidatus Paceibacterota bacterium]
MTIAKDFASKAGIAFVALAMIFTMSVPASNAQTQTPEDLQKMIDTLMAQIEALKGGTASATASGYTWTRDLKTGATGADVMELQKFLNSNEDTRVAATGVGSAGMETSYFGPATAAAVSKFQMKYRADILSPAGLVNPTGFFGPSTRAKANAMNTVTTPTPDEDEDGSTDEDEDEDTTLSGEASLTTFEVADGEDADDVEEGSEDIAVGEFTVEFADGDAEISRLDLALEVDSGNDGDDDPWKVFEEISLWVDGEEVARVDASNEDDYLDEDDGSLRFSDLEIIANEDEEVTIVVAASVASSIDGSANGEGWNIAAGALRFFDADGVASTETTFGDLQDISGVTLAAPIAEFTIEEAGAGDDLDLESSDEDPDSSTISLDEDDNTEATIFAFDLSAEDSDGDVDLNEISVTATVTVATDIDDLVNDFTLEIDGQEFSAESYVGTNATVTLVFDIDGDVTIGADEVVTAKLIADFEQMEVGDEGSTIVAQVATADIDAEGADDITVDGSTVTGEIHTLRTEGVSVELVDETVTAIENDDTDQTDDEAKFVLEFEVTAFGDTVYLPFGATASTTDLTEGVVYSIINTNTNAVVTTGTTTPSFDMDGSGETNSFKISDGSSETFTLEVTFDPAASGSYKLRLDEINFATTDAATATNSQDVSDEDIDTAQTTITS